MCIRDRNIEYLRKGLSKHRLADTRGSEKNDIALLDLNIAVLRAVYSLIVVIDRDAQRFLRLVLTYNILVELLFDLMGLGERLITRALTALAAGTLFVRLNDIEALLHTLVADIYPRTCLLYTSRATQHRQSLSPSGENINDIAPPILPSILNFASAA